MPVGMNQEEEVLDAASSDSSQDTSHNISRSGIGEQQTLRSSQRVPEGSESAIRLESERN